MLYLDTDINGFDLDEAIAELPEWRRTQVLAIKREEGRRLSVVAYRLLCRGLRREYGIDVPPSFAYEEGGKPYLKDYPRIHFNLSHCRAGAACVVAGHPVGVDIETVRPYKDALARYVLNDEEYAMVAESPNPASQFIRLWTMKEAYAKLTGRGLRDDLKTLLPIEGYSYRTQTLFPADGGQPLIVTVCKCKPSQR